ncbi:MAG: ABC transporter substrate-binding protein, partial [Treponema sp.]|nr:ABC transporter substrate-binding protein [Treponema sp.]
MKNARFLAGGLCLVLLFFSCSRSEELSLEEIERRGAGGVEQILAKTTSKPWRGEEFIPGRLDGTWYDVMSTEPKSFNVLMAEQDNATNAVVRQMQDFLVEYDVVRREWKPRSASFEIRSDEEAGTLDLIYTLRDDLYWSYYNSDQRAPVTSDDVVFWYNEIEGDPAFNSSGYNGQFIRMEDGTEAHIDIEKIDAKRFVFHFPRIVAEPLLTTNATIAPRLDYEAAKRERGVQGVLDLFSVDGDPRRIPSMGEWFLTEYTPGQRLVYKRNPHYWQKDQNGLSLPYIEEQIVRIIPDENTKFLLFKEGQIESYTARPEDLDELINKPDADYTVFNAEGSLLSSFWTFNQNPKLQDTPQYEWFTQKEFRQAMSCLLNRERIASQVYRGLAEPKFNFFPEPNPYYNPNITLEYRYDPDRARELLESIGMKKDLLGTLRDGRRR